MEEERSLKEMLKEVVEENKMWKERCSRMEEKINGFEVRWRSMLEALDEREKERDEWERIRDEEMEKIKNALAVLEIDWELKKEELKEKEGENKDESSSAKRRRLENPNQSEKSVDEEGVEESSLNIEDKIDKEKEREDAKEKEQGSEEESEEDGYYKYKVIVKRGRKNGDLLNMEDWMEEMRIRDWKVEKITDWTVIVWLSRRKDWSWIIENRDGINGCGYYIVERYLSEREKWVKKKLTDFAFEEKRKAERRGDRIKLVRGDGWVKIDGWVYIYDDREGVIKLERDWKNDRRLPK